MAIDDVLLIRVHRKGIGYGKTQCYSSSKILYHVDALRAIKNQPNGWIKRKGGSNAASLLYRSHLVGSWYGGNGVTLAYVVSPWSACGRCASRVLDSVPAHYAGGERPLDFTYFTLPKVSSGLEEAEVNQPSLQPGASVGDPRWYPSRQREKPGRLSEVHGRDPIEGRDDRRSGAAGDGGVGRDVLRVEICRRGARAVVVGAVADLALTNVTLENVPGVHFHGSPTFLLPSRAIGERLTHRPNVDLYKSIISYYIGLVNAWPFYLYYEYLRCTFLFFSWDFLHIIGFYVLNKLISLV